MEEQSSGHAQNPEPIPQTAPRSGVSLRIAVPLAILAVAVGFLAGRLTAPRQISETNPVRATGIIPSVPDLPATTVSDALPVDHTNPASSVASAISPSVTAKPVLIPSDWKPYTVSGGQYGYKTTLSLPPGYVFHIVGSGDMIIQNESDASELWELTTSKFNGPQGIRNYYDGSSRRAWYQGYLDGKYASPDEYEKKRGDILSVTEKQIGNTSFLDLKAKMTTGVTERQFIHVQNGILHIFRPGSNAAYAGTAKVPSFMDTVLASLKTVEVQK